MLKKMVSLIVVFCMTMGIVSIPVQAEELDRVVYSQTTDFDGIKKDLDKEMYGMEFFNTKTKKAEIIPVGRLDIDLKDNTEVDAVLASSQVPTEVKEYIEDLAKEHPAAEVVYFSTAFNGTGLQNLASNSSTTDYYTYGGTPMRNDRVYAYGLNTGYEYIEEGPNTKIAAAMAEEVVLTGASFLFEKVEKMNIVLAGISLLDCFLEEFAESVITPHGKDYLQMRLDFDSVRQFTYAKVDSEWEIGAVTGRVKVNTVESTQFYWNTETSSGNTLDTEYHPNVEYEGSLYSYPYPTAKQWAGNPKTENLSWEVGDKKFAFY